MRRFIIGLLFFIPVLTCYTQEKKFTIRTGAGYYADVMSFYNGPAFWLEGGFKLSTGFYLNGRISLSTVDWTINHGFFEDYRTILVRQMADITFSRPVKLKGRHFIEPALGFKLKRELNFNPDITIQTVDQQTYVYTRYSQTFYEIGFTLCLDYYYQFQSNIYVGFRADTNVIWALGFEGLTLSPLVGFRF